MSEQKTKIISKRSSEEPKPAEGELGEASLDKVSGGHSDMTITKQTDTASPK